MTQILIADKLADSLVGALEAVGASVRNEPNLTAGDLPAVVGDTEILVVRSTRVTADTIRAANSLSLVIRAGAGVNTIDVPAASQRGISVANCPGKNAAAVAELAMGLLIAADRRIVNACTEMRERRWRKKQYGNSHGLKDRTLGILGWGAIGRAVAQRARGFEMKVLAWSRSLTPEQAQELGATCADSAMDVARNSDAVSIHLALTPDTQHLVSTDFLAAMRPGAILINTSRGPLVDTSALKAAIAEKQLRVGMDVFEQEPEGGEAEFADPDLAQAATVTPHIGASTAQTSEAIGAEVARIVAGHIQTGHVPSAVNLCAKTPATHRMIVRHLNRVGVLARVLDGLREENINVEEMDNTIFEGAEAAVCALRLDGAPSQRLVASLSSSENILHASVSSD